MIKPIRSILAACLAWLAFVVSARGEAMLQYFNTSWSEITAKMPELAEAGYSSLWLPPPTKGSGGLSVGYDCWDRFDLGSKNQRGSIRTRYGTEAELLEMVRTAHRFGIRVYFDNVMNHNAFDVPGFNAFTPIDVYPGFLPEDFHLRRTEDGFYRKWDNTRDWNDAWQVQHLGLSDLIDIATEPGSTNRNHGSYEGDTIPKIAFVRHPANPEYYCYIPTAPGQSHARGQGTYVGFGPGNGITTGMLAANASFYAEYVEDMLHRSARWQIDRTKADGFRLDAVKHTPADFFGATFGADKDSSSYGFNGQIQLQFNLSRGFSDWSNHRDSLFNIEQGRDDAMLFGEHLGQPPAYGPYVDSGMRLIDNDLRSNFNNLLGNPSSGLNGFDQPGSGGFAPSVAVMHAQSHDNDFAARRELQHAFYFTREGLGLVYTDGNYHAETLGESGGAFPRHSNTSFLGQWGDGRIPNLLKIHRDFARGYQLGRWSDSDFVAYERLDKRENGGMNNSDAATMIIMLNDNYANGQSRPLATSFRSVGGAGSENNVNTNDEYLYQYARGYGSQVGFYTYASQLGSVIVPPGSYFVFAPRTPEESDLWRNAGGSPLTILQDGQPAGSIEVVRRDGPDGDPAFNPYGVTDLDANDYAYRISVPRVTSATDLDFIVRADGSAENILLKLGGGIDLNGTRPPGNADPFYRDNPPAVSTDVFLGYEQPIFAKRIHAEKFAAVDTTRNQIGSAGAETYIRTVGGTGFTVVNGPVGANNYSSDGGNRAQFLYHDPQAAVGGTPGGGWPGGGAPQQYDESGAQIAVWAKPNGVGPGFKMWFYYTTNGTNPEGAGGSGTGSTKVVEMNFSHNEGGNDWWLTANIPKPGNGTQLRYKIGIHKEGASSIYPSGGGSVAAKKAMMTEFRIEGFNPSTAVYAPHNDYGVSSTGLDEGFHVIKARAFLNRAGKASLYNTFVQTFYYDAQRPQGEIAFPAVDGDTVGGSEYGAVVRTDPSVTAVSYRIVDGDPSNDDSVTGGENGNGAWVDAVKVTPTASITPGNPAYRDEWRFNFVNIPSTGSASIQVRLREISSADDDNLSDTAGHFTTLVRTVNTAGPDVRMFVAFPASDGQVIDTNYVLKAYFSKSLADGLSEAALKSRFLVRFAGDESWPAGIQVLDPAAMSIVYNEIADFHALAFTLPSLHNGVDDFLHRIEVRHDRPDPNADLTATRRVRAAPSNAPRVTILQPQEFDSNGKLVLTVLPDGPGADSLENLVRVETDLSATSVDLTFALGSGGIEAVDANEATPEIDPVVQGSSKIWDFVWTVTAPGSFRLVATAQGPGESAQDRRNVTVILRQLVAANPNDVDDDDDGLADVDEGTPLPLPNGFPAGDPRYKPNPEQWTNGEIHVHNAYGRSDPLMPDSDGDGLPDGLEVGWRQPGPDTNAGTDTNADGRPNFIGDLDPPFYNTLDNLGSVPGVNSASEGGDRAKRLFGSMTDPGNPDSDGDGLPDGIEDANANGWVDGDGAPLATNASPSLGRNWPNGRRDPGEVWTETSPTDADSDDDGLSDGSGEDMDSNGFITGDTNNNRIWENGEVWLETDPLNDDTDGDGLPDGWERQFGLNPLDDGSIAFDGSTPDSNNGAAGDPDGDGIGNLQELLAGTDPRTDNSVVLEPGEEIVIGPVANDAAITRGAVVNRQEFTDWRIDDLVVLDEFEGDGSGNQGGDTYLGYDGFDSSRDLVAFYARDGGDPSVGGTGDFYFRADFHDLRPFAEEGNLDLYVVIDTGNTAIGEYALPDEVDTGTLMRWEAVVAVYQSNTGAVLVDTNPANNTTAINENLGTRGVVRRDQTSPDGFRKAWFNSDLDAVEFSISRKALLDAGWLGDPDTLNFQVFVTRDGTRNSPQGAGDIGGRSDIRDTIYDDWLAEDYWREQGYIGQNSELRSWFNYQGPDRGRRAKVMLLAHGNEAISPGSDIQQRISDATTQTAINAGTAGGYYRLLDAHDAYAAKLGLHLTPTLASSIEWAAVDPAVNRPWRDGPGFNRRLGALAEAGTVEIVGSTFADAPLAYFDASWLADNVALSHRFLTEIYGTAPSSRVFWVPERVYDDGVMSRVAGLGYTHVFVDQFRHILDRFGRQAALLDDGYRINRFNGLNAMVINDQASSFRFRNTDRGLDINLRQLLSRKSRSGEQHQLVIFYSDLSDFRNAADATAYDRNLAWLASRPWVEIVGPEQVASGAVDLSLPPDGAGDNFASINRGTTSFTRKLGPLWLDHATQGNYDFWWFGSSQEESLRDKIFEWRPGASVAPAGDDFYGVQSFGGSGAGIAAQAWSMLNGASNDRLGRVSRGIYHASTFLAGWHDEDNNDLRTYSTGAFIYPDTSFDPLAGFAKRAQAQTRQAARHAAVAAWAAAPPSSTQAVAADVDLDGVDEYVLRNARVMAVFETLGGRCVAAWAMGSDGVPVQIVGNPLSMPEFETEEEGAGNRNPDGSVLARRTSAFKDWYANGSGGGSTAYVNQLYTASPVSGGWTFTSPNGAISKTITLADNADALVAQYALSGPVNKLFVRFGLSPDLDSLLIRGQTGLSLAPVPGGVRVENEIDGLSASGEIGLVSNVTWQSAATDDDVAAFDTIPMRNQAQTQQVEVESQSTTFTVSLALAAVVGDADGDGLPADWELANGLDDNDASGVNGAAGDPDGDGLSNLNEWLFGTLPQVAGPAPSAGLEKIAGGFRVRFSAVPDRLVQFQSSPNLVDWTDLGPEFDTIGESGPGVISFDDLNSETRRFYRVILSAP